MVKGYGFVFSLYSFFLLLLDLPETTKIITWKYKNKKSTQSSSTDLKAWGRRNASV